ncbi:MAG: hypothetical protein ACT4TC_02270 [Myxococcaceae bacterium]
MLALVLVVACRTGSAPDSAKAPEPDKKEEVKAPPAKARPTLYFTELRPFLPKELEGYTTTRDEGSTGKYGDVAVSEAERVFAQDQGGSATVRIVDTSMSDKLGHAIRAAVVDAQARGTPAPIAPILLDNVQGFVRYDADASKAEANLLVADRFVVAVTTLGFEGTDELRRIAYGLNLAGLSKLR